MQGNLKTVVSELGPPMKFDMKALNAGFKGLTGEVQGVGAMTFKELGVKAVVCFEVFCWFTAGTIIGRGQLRGYGYPKPLGH